jgi:uncharacterized protein YfaS (alpha-2-macroglobulin family)
MRFLLPFLLFCLTAPLMAQSYDQQLATVERLAEDGKFRSALDAADELYELANGPAELVRALDYRLAYTRQLNEDGEEAAYQLLKSVVDERAEEPVAAALLHVLLGEYLIQFAEQNSYRLSQQTEISGATATTDTPLTEYSLQQLLDAGRGHIYRGLELARANRTELQSLTTLVAGDTARRDELPTLYDLLLQRALNVLGSDLGMVTDERPADVASLLVDAAAFCEIDLAERYDTTRGTPRKLVLYQDWICHRLGAGEGGLPLLVADLERLRYVHQLGAADTAYYTALEAARQRYRHLPASDRFLVDMAELLDRDDNTFGVWPRVRALALLDRVGEEDEVARIRAEQLRMGITATSLQVTTQEFYPLRQHHLVSLSYRNVERVYYRVYPYDATKAPRRGRTELADIMRPRPVASGNQRLAANDDYAPHRSELDLDPLPAGSYALVVSDNARFREGDMTASYVFFQVTDLSILIVEGGAEDYVQVANRSTGAPVANVDVTVRQRTRNDGYRQLATRRSDREGTFTLPQGERYYGLQLELRDPRTDDRMITDAYTNRRYAEDRRKQQYTTLLLDRNLYRPGQRVYVYGLRYELDEDRMPSILKNAELTVRLRDANYQEVATESVTTDAYGRFHTSFTLPEGGLTGNFSIQTENGNTAFRVEEYKRPRFRVELTAPPAARRGIATTIEGTAETYAGPPVTDARVNYRIFIEEQFWRYYFGGGGGGDRELVASGTTETGEDGSFQFDFTPSATLSTGGYRSYRFVVETDVADGTGETHEATAAFGLIGDRPAIIIQPERELIDRRDSLSLRIAMPTADTSLTVQLRIVPVTKPNAALLERSWEAPDRPVIEPRAFARNFPNLAYAPVPEVREWPATGEAVIERQVTVDQPLDRLQLPADLPTGHYRIEWSYPDGTAGDPSTFAVYNATDGELPAGELYILHGSEQTVEVGRPLTLTLLSAVDLPLILTHWESRRGATTDRASSNGRIDFTYTPTEADRGGLQFAFATVRLNRYLSAEARFNLDWENKKLEVTYATFRDKLRPGTPERWTLTLRGEDEQPAAATALATMYDASLDQLFPGQGWAFNPYPDFYGGRGLARTSTFGSVGGRSLRPTSDRKNEQLPGLPYLNMGQRGNAKAFGGAIRMRGVSRLQYAAPEMDAMVEEESVDDTANVSTSAPPPPPPPPGYNESETDQAPVQIRTNLQETAFWLPELTAGPDGSLQVSFTSPEALTAWKFRLFAHDEKVRYVISEREVVTQKELMVLPNVPRFFREGDEIELTARVSNMTEENMPVEVSLELYNPETDEPITDFALGAPIAIGAGASMMENIQQIPAKESVTARFRLSIPEGASLRGPVGYRIIARSTNFSDGEANVVPVLSDRTLITVSRPFYLRRKDRKKITIDQLTDIDPALQSVGYTLQSTTNPAWLALKALPYLMEYPYDCTEQLANRYFANQLAYATVAAKPVLEEVFRRWQADSTALLSELEKNESLKNALLTETPWVREAQSETRQRARIAELFQLKKLAEEQSAALAKLAARQENDGAYSWFPGGPSNRYMTQYVVETFARMRQLGVLDATATATVDRITEGAVGYLDRQLAEDYRKLRDRAEEDDDLLATYRPSSLQVHYLYARAMSGAASSKRSEALAYFQKRAFAEWLQYDLYEQALIALAGHATGDGIGTKVIASLRERALQSDEFGMYWKYGRGYRWSNLPIETHTRILEAFRRIDPRPEELDEMRLWLLSNKRTNRWPTTKATAAAVYALLQAEEGRFTVNDDPQPLEASWSGSVGKELGSRVRAQQENAEAATGSFTVRVGGDEVTSDLATVRLKNPGNDLVWGGIFWQYTAPAELVEASEKGPLSLSRELYRKEGGRLVPIDADQPLRPGDRVTVRLTITSDRELDYVHLKDRRAATFEPVDALSTYRYSGGLGYYQAPGDLATNFFIDQLPKGSYVLEYDLFATYAGDFSNGLGRIQCMYAPEFGGNTVGGRIAVR